MVPLRVCGGRLIGLHRNHFAAHLRVGNGAGNWQFSRMRFRFNFNVLDGMVDSCLPDQQPNFSHSRSISNLPINI
jgi:hypothetical protein